MCYTLVVTSKETSEQVATMTISPKDIHIVIPAKAGIQEGRGVDSRPRIGVRGRLLGSGLDLFRPFQEPMERNLQENEIKIPK